MLCEVASEIRRCFGTWFHVKTDIIINQFFAENRRKRKGVFTLKLKTRLNGKTYEFRDVKDVLAKANEPKSGDRYLGIAPETVSEKIAAKVVLSELTVADITENPVVPY